MANHNKVAHAWANKTGKHRKGFNMFYEGDTIYSYGYHFPIATHYDAPNGQHVVLFTEQSYSISTSKHKAYTWRACHHLDVVEVPSLSVWSTGKANVDERMARKWHEAKIQKASGHVSKAKRARKYGGKHIESAREALRLANRYNALWSLGLPEATLESLDRDVAVILERIRLQTLADIEANYKRDQEEKAQAIKEWHEDPNRRAAWKAWLMGATLEGRGYYNQDNPLIIRPLPRVKGDKVETTWGASVPLDLALQAYRMAKSCRAKHKAFVPETSARMMVGDFSLRHIKANGDLVIGCHDIPFRFMQYAARKAGLDN